MLRLSPRGIGQNWIACFICQKDPYNRVAEGSLKYEGSCQPDMACHVPNYQHALNVQDIFTKVGLRVYIDYRPNQNGYTQVKLGCCREHLPILRNLEDALITANSMVSERLLREVISADLLRPE